MADPRSEWGREIVESVNALQGSMVALQGSMADRFTALQKDLASSETRTTQGINDLKLESARENAEIKRELKQGDAEIRQDLTEFRSSINTLKSVGKWVGYPLISVTIIGVVTGISTVVEVRQHTEQLNRIFGAVDGSKEAAQARMAPPPALDPPPPEGADADRNRDRDDQQLALAIKQRLDQTDARISRDIEAGLGRVGERVAQTIEGHLVRLDRPPGAAGGDQVRVDVMAGEDPSGAFIPESDGRGGTETVVTYLVRGGGGDDLIAGQSGAVLAPDRDLTELVGDPAKGPTELTAIYLGKDSFLIRMSFPDEDSARTFVDITVKRPLHLLLVFDRVTLRP